MIDARVGVRVLCALLGSTLAAAVAAQPANDACHAASPIRDGVTRFSTRDATSDESGGKTYNDIWFRHIAECTGTLRVNTCGTADFDTDVTIYDGCDCDATASSVAACTTSPCAIATQTPSANAARRAT